MTEMTETTFYFAHKHYPVTPKQKRFLEELAKRFGYVEQLVECLSRDTQSNVWCELMEAMKCCLAEVIGIESDEDEDFDETFVRFIPNYDQQYKSEPEPFGPSMDSMIAITKGSGVWLKDATPTHIRQWRDYDPDARKNPWCNLILTLFEQYPEAKTYSELKVFYEKDHASASIN